MALPTDWDEQETLNFQLEFLTKRRVWFNEQIEKLNVKIPVATEYTRLLENFIIQYANSKDFEYYVHRNS